MTDAVVTDILALAKNKPQRTAPAAVTEHTAVNAEGVPQSHVPQDMTCELISAEKLVPYSNNPFALYVGERLAQLVESVRDNGIITPLIVRPLEDGEYQILAGHNRHNAACIVGLDKVPCFVRNVDEDEALEIVLETNFAQRSITDMMPSELAKSLQMQVELFKNKGKRNDLVRRMHELMNDKYGDVENLEDCENSTYGHGDRRLKNEAVITLSDSTRRRYMRLNLLDEDLLALVDSGFITVLCGVELSYLKGFEQELIVSFLEENTAELDKKKLAKLRELSRENALNAQKIRLVLSEQQAKTDFVPKITKPSRTIRDMFPAGTKAKTIESTIVTALKLYFEKASKESDYETA